MIILVMEGSATTFSRASQLISVAAVGPGMETAIHGIKQNNHSKNHLPN